MKSKPLTGHICLLFKFPLCLCLSLRGFISLPLYLLSLVKVSNLHLQHRLINKEFFTFFLVLVLYLHLLPCFSAKPKSHPKLSYFNALAFVLLIDFYFPILHYGFFWRSEWLLTVSLPSNPVKTLFSETVFGHYSDWKLPSSPTLLQIWLLILSLKHFQDKVSHAPILVAKCIPYTFFTDYWMSVPCVQR